jgi:methionyl-tRNA synthetase
VIYVWFDALINYITGAGFPDDPEAFASGGRPTCTSSARTSTVPHGHLAGDAHERGLELPRKVWVHGFMTIRGEKMSKRPRQLHGPTDVIGAFGPDGTRFVTLASSRSTRTPMSPGRASSGATTRTSRTTTATS